jgi:hypothetical protein
MKIAAGMKLVMMMSHSDRKEAVAWVGAASAGAEAGDRGGAAGGGVSAAGGETGMPSRPGRSAFAAGPLGVSAAGGEVVMSWEVVLLSSAMGCSFLVDINSIKEEGSREPGVIRHRGRPLGAITEHHIRRTGCVTEEIKAG